MISQQEDQDHYTKIQIMISDTLSKLTLTTVLKEDSPVLPLAIFYHDDCVLHEIPGCY